jgi:catechol 2,3-dioxygenase-like lactoylglutathione lyase family enzyme
MNFTGICLVTDDVLQLADFYCNVLGVESDGDDNHVELKTSGAVLTIFSNKGMEEMAPGCMIGSGVGGFTMGFEVSDVDEEFIRLQTLGVFFVKQPKSYPWGTRSVWFRDPDGNIINFYQTLKES